MTRNAQCKLFLAIVSGAALLLGACTDQGPAPRMGALRVTLATVGLDPDADGYTLRVDARPLQAVPINGTMLLDSLVPGSHSVVLNELAANCTATGANSLSVDIVADSTAEVAFAVACASHFVAVSSGYSHTCGITTRGATYCWGNNGFGQLGDGSNGASSGIPVAVLGGSAFAAVSAGGGYTCGVTAGGTAYCWGSNYGGTLGTGTTTGPEQCGGQISCSTVPVEVVGGLTWAGVSAGLLHTCGTTTGGEAYCWGMNNWGELGDGTRTNRASPVAVAGGLVFTAVTAGAAYACAVTTGGDAYCWGDDTRGQLGDDTAAQCSPALHCSTVPVAVLGGLTFAAVTARHLHTCGVTAGGEAYCWGSNYIGVLGDGTTTDRSTPVAVLGGLTFATVSAGGVRTCGVTTGGEAYCWGNLNTTPVSVPGGLTFSTLSTGENHTCGLTTGGVLYCWGQNDGGQLGGGTLGGYSNTLVKVVGQP